MNAAIEQMMNDEIDYVNTCPYLRGKDNAEKRALAIKNIEQKYGK